jgi:zinc protease
MNIELPSTQFELKNGLQLIVHEDHSVPLVAVNLWYRVGSKDERPGRTGFAHLFEHLMFEGSENVPVGVFDSLLESVGGVNNGSTSTDRTNYWETVPSNALELALFLEADRMAGLIDVMTEEKLNAQRDVVKNERRQSYENQPYGLAGETITAALYPPDHPYHWPVIGWMKDLDAATLEDVNEFFRTFYNPRNASLAVAGAVNAADVHELVQQHFGAIPKGSHVSKVKAAPGPLAQRTYQTIDDEVNLPRLYFAWHSPAMFAEDDAELDVLSSTLGQGKSARLYKTLVYEKKIAQDVEAMQSSALLSSTFELTITARPDANLAELEKMVWAELEAAATRISDDEVERAVRRIETATVDSLQTVGGFGGRADRLNHYAFYAGDPNYVQRDLDRYQEVDAAGVARAARAHLLEQHGVVLTVLPRAASNGGAQ